MCVIIYYRCKIYYCRRRRRSLVHSQKSPRVGRAIPPPRDRIIVIYRMVNGELDIIVFYVFLALL